MPLKAHSLLLARHLLQRGVALLLHDGEIPYRPVSLSLKDQLVALLFGGYHLLVIVHALLQELLIALGSVEIQYLLSLHCVLALLLLLCHHLTLPIGSLLNLFCSLSLECLLVIKQALQPGAVRWQVLRDSLGLRLQVELVVALKGLESQLPLYVFAGLHLLHALED